MNIGAAMNDWINSNFRNPNRPKCLVLIGATGTGIFGSTLTLCYCRL